ncbi:MAG: T9SS type A sorting domain-containing protein [Bacteroidales bacterium]
MDSLKIFVWILFLFIVNPLLFPQKEYILESDWRMGFRNVRIDNNGDFISLFNEDSAYYHYTGGIIKFDSDFNYEIYKHDVDTAHVVFNDFIVTPENNYLITGTIGKDNGIGYSNHILYFLLLDENFNVLAENFYSLCEDCNNPYIKMLQNTDDRIYVTLVGVTPLFKGIIEISASLEVLKDSIYFDNPGGIMNPFPSNGAGFYFLGGSEFPWAVGQITAVDTNLNLTTTVLPYYINGQYYKMGSRGSCKWLNDTIYILVSEGSSSSYGLDLYLYKMNHNHEFLTEPFIIGSENIDDQSLYFTGIDWTNSESIYVASWQWPSMFGQTTYFVALINENFEVLGAKSYGGNNNTVVNSMVTTVDGGCVMVGTQRNYLAGDEFDFNGYVVFFQPNDIITSAVETTAPNDSDYRLFPNPGSDHLTIQTACKRVLLRIFDSKGVLILEQELSDTFQQQIDTRELKPGIYVCRLSDINGFTENIKWIKK